MTSLQHLPDTITRRGISPETAAHFAIELTTEYRQEFLSYPVGAAVRQKNANSDAKPKYRWKSGEAEIYNCDALAAADGEIWIVNGEPVVWQLHTAGIPAISFFGEQNIPAELPNLLGLYGIHTVYLPPDNDTTGQKAAPKLSGILSARNISVFAYSIPDYWRAKFGEDCPKGADLGDLLERLCIDPETGLIAPDLAAAMLDELKRYPLHIEPEAPAPKPQRRKPKSNDNDYQDYYAAIEQALGITEYKSNGWSKKAVACPFGNHQHDDKRPAAHWHRDKHILKCFKCGEWQLAKDTAAALGIEWKPPVDAGIPAGNLDTAPETSFTQINEVYHFPQGIPDALREELLNLHLETSINDHAPALIVLELRQHAIHEQHITPQEPITVNWLIDYAARIDWHTSEGVIRRGLKQLEALGFLDISQVQSEGKGRPIDHYHPQPLADALSRLREVLSYRIRERIFSVETPDEITPAWFDNLSPEAAQKLADRGNARRQTLYEEHDDARQEAEQQAERHIQAMQRRLRPSNLLAAHSSALVTDLTCQKSSAYRALYYRSKVASEAERTIARAKVAAQLGVSSKSVSELRIRAGIIAEEQFEMMEITSPENVLASVDEQFPWAKNREFGKFLDNGNGNRRSLSYNKPEEIDRWVKNELAHDRPVTAYIQTASRERLASEGEQADKITTYADKRPRRQSRPLMKTGDKRPDPLEELLATINEEASPRAFSIGYKLRQVAMLPGISKGDLLAYFDLFSNGHPLETADSYRGGRFENKSASGGSTLPQKEGVGEFEAFAIAEFGAEIEVIE